MEVNFILMLVENILISQMKDFVIIGQMEQNQLLKQNILMVLKVIFGVQ